MITVLLSIFAGVAAGLALWLSDTTGYGWSVFFGVLAFGVVQLLAGFMIQRKVKAAMTGVQSILVAGQKRLQAKVARWQLRPPGSMQAAQAEMERDQKVFVKEALLATEALHRFDLWVPLMKRQIATAQFQLHWMAREFKDVDALMSKAMFMDPMMSAMKLARMQMLDAPVDEIARVYAKAVRRLRYNQNVLLAATYSWILMQRGDADGAFKALNRALEKSDNEVLKSNREQLANNKLAHFSNAGLGDQWYALHLEKPRYNQPRQRMQWR